MSDENDKSAEFNAVLAKNAELLDELKKAKKLNTRFKDIDLDGLTGAKDELAALKKKGMEEKEEYKALYENQVNETNKFKGSLEETRGKVAKLKKKQAINDALPDIIPELREMAINTLVSGVTVGDDGRVMAGDKSVKDYVNDWAESEVGKHFRKAPVNSGGNAAGNNGDGHSSDFDCFKRGDTWNLTEQGKIAKRDPELYRKMKKQYSNA